jgi:hypothetical protein
VPPFPPALRPLLPHGRHARPTALAAACLLVAASALTAASASAAPTDARCADVVLVTVRGSSTPAGTGDGPSPYVYGSGGLEPTFQGIVDRVQGDPDHSVHVEALRYSASIFPGLGGRRTDYVASLAEGETALRGEMEDLASACPASTVQAVAYSQGSQVVGDVLATADRLSDAARAHLGGVVLLGDPTYRSGEIWDAPGNGGGPGLFRRGPGAFDPWTRDAADGSAVSIVRSWCNPHDVVCQRSYSFPAHRAYDRPAIQDAAAAFLRGLLDAFPRTPQAAGRP